MGLSLVGSGEQMGNVSVSAFVTPKGGYVGIGTHWDGRLLTAEVADYPDWQDTPLTYGQAGVAAAGGRRSSRGSASRAMIPRPPPLPQLRGRGRGWEFPP